MQANSYILKKLVDFLKKEQENLKNHVMNNVAENELHVCRGEFMAYGKIMQQLEIYQKEAKEMLEKNDFD